MNNLIDYMRSGDGWPRNDDRSGGTHKVNQKKLLENVKP
jgi:hypothetical protein